MRLLFVGYLHGYGGAEKQLIMLANEMAERCHDVALVSLSENNPCFQISSKVSYDYFLDRYKLRLLNIGSRFLYLKRKIKEIAPDLIIHFNLQSAYMCAFMGKKISLSTIYAERGDPYDKEYTGMLAIIRKFMCKKIGGFVFQTKGAQEFFPLYVREKSIVVSNPIFINPKEYNRVSAPDNRIVTVGRLHEQKNHRLLINAIAKLPLEYKQYRVEIYGAGELKEELQKQIDENNLTHQVFLMGACSNVIEKIKNAALFVLTSDYEGMPNALMEAMALGIPCISTDCRPGGARELIKSGEEGLIVPCNNAEKLKAALIQMLDNQFAAEKMGEKAKDKMKNFAPEIIYSRWEGFFELITQRGGNNIEC